MKILLVMLATLMVACGPLSRTRTVFRSDPREDKIRGDGYMLACFATENVVWVVKYTPLLWGEHQYYGNFDGQKTDKQVSIDVLGLSFVGTKDSLFLVAADENSYRYIKSDRSKIVAADGDITMSILVTDLATKKVEAHEYTLKHTEVTSWSLPSFRVH